MPDMVELIPASDEAVFRAWEDGKGPQALSREFALTVPQVEQILDRMLPVFDAQSQLRAFKRELRRLEDLSGEFFAIAKRDKNHESALFARLNERILRNARILAGQREDGPAHGAGGGTALVVRSDRGCDQSDC